MFINAESGNAIPCLNFMSAIVKIEHKYKFPDL